MRLYINSIIFFMLSCGWSQQQIVLNSLTDKPIPFVSIYHYGNNIGTYTNESGEFKIETLGDSLLLSHLGYKNKVVKNFEKDTIFMQPLRNELDEIVISQKIKCKKIGLDKKWSHSSWIAGTKTEYLSLIIIDSLYKNYNLEKIHIPIKKTINSTKNKIDLKNLKAVLRINIYSVSDNLPDKKVFSSQPIKTKIDSKNNIEVKIEEPIKLNKNIFIGVEVLGYMDNLGNFSETKEGFLRLKFTKKTSRYFKSKSFVKLVFSKQNRIISIDKLRRQHDVDKKNYNLALGLTICSYE